MKPETMLVIPDTHVSYLGSPEGGIDPKAESLLWQALPIVKPTIVAHIGDIGEWNSFSHWQWKHKRRPPFEYMREVLDNETTCVNTWLDTLQRKLDKTPCERVLITQGNHEVWCDNLAEEEARPEYAAHALLRIAQRGYEWHEHGAFAQVGKLYLTHGGHFTGLNHAHKTAVGLSASCLYGHFHSVQFAHVKHLGGSHGAWCIGSLCKLQKRFLNHKPTDWSHALAIVHFESDGSFHVEIVDIFDGVAYVYGRRLEAK